MSPAKPTFREALAFWTKLGFISFGGPAGQIAIMHEFLVEKKKWISDSRFLHALNYCMVLPGPEAQQLATYIGWLLHGRMGGLAAGVLFVLPSMFILLALSAAYVGYRDIPAVYAMFNGLKPAVVAIVILALVKIGKKSLHSALHYFIAVAAFICIFVLNIPFPLIIAGAVVLGFAVRRMFPDVFAWSLEDGEKEEKNERSFYINRYSGIGNAGFRPTVLARQLAVAVVLWVFPLALFYAFSEDFGFWKQLTLFFTQAAFITFGGAYAVLPYVAQVSVEKLHWLSSFEMLDGLALGETTPGPLIMVLAFVGFMAAFHHYGGSLLMAALGLGVTVFYTFLPCFLFILAGAPIIEATQNNRQIKDILSIITAAVVGVILNLVFYLGKSVFFPAEFSLARPDFVAAVWVLVSLLAMHRFKINMILWIALSAVFGLMRYWV